jgi:hypothetical protein
VAVGGRGVGVAVGGKGVGVSEGGRGVALLVGEGGGAVGVGTTLGLAQLASTRETKTRMASFFDIGTLPSYKIQSVGAFN